MSKHRFPVAIRIERRVKVPAENGEGYTTRSDGWETREVVVEVDIEQLAQQLGARAIRSKGRKAIEAGGAIVVRPI